MGTAVARSSRRSQATSADGSAVSTSRRTSAGQEPEPTSWTTARAASTAPAATAAGSNSPRRQPASRAAAVDASSTPAYPAATCVPGPPDRSAGDGGAGHQPGEHGHGARRPQERVDVGLQPDDEQTGRSRDRQHGRSRGGGEGRGPGGRRPAAHAQHPPRHRGRERDPGQRAPPAQHDRQAGQRDGEQRAGARRARGEVGQQAHGRELADRPGAQRPGQRPGLQPCDAGQGQREQRRAHRAPGQERTAVVDARRGEDHGGRGQRLAGPGQAMRRRPGRQRSGGEGAGEQQGTRPGRALPERDRAGGQQHRADRQHDLRRPDTGGEVRHAPTLGGGSASGRPAAQRIWDTQATASRACWRRCSYVAPTTSRASPTVPRVIQRGSSGA